MESQTQPGSSTCQSVLGLRPCIFPSPASESTQECPGLCLTSSLSLRDKADGLVIPRLWKEPGAHVAREGFPFLFGFTTAQTSFYPVFSISQSVLVHTCASALGKLGREGPLSLWLIRNIPKQSPVPAYRTRPPPHTKAVAPGVSIASLLDAAV